MNVVCIVVDSLRADHLGCYGYSKNTSPRLDALAREGVLFRSTFAPGIPTTPSFTTLFTGLHPYRHGIVAHGGDALLGKEVLTLPQLFQNAGYTTIGIDNLVVQGNGRGSWFSRGFDFYSAFSYQPFGAQSTQLVERAIRFLRDPNFNWQNDPFFLFVHLWSPHTPYAPPAPYDTLHYQPGSTLNLPSLDEIKALSPEYYESFLGDMKLQKPNDAEWICAQYDGEISYTDAQIGRILDELEFLGLQDDTLVLILGDHGECFGEGNLWFDHHGLYDAVIRLPFIARTPKNWNSGNLQCDNFLSHEDIFPTLVECCNLPSPEYSSKYSPSGQSFAPLLRGEKLETAREFLIGVESTRQASLCLRTEKWKLILPVTRDARGNSLPDFYGCAREEQVLLFDLESDPGETRDVGQEYSAVRDQLLQTLQAWRAAEVEKRGGHDPVLDGLGLPFDEFMSRLTARGLRA